MRRGRTNRTPGGRRAWLYAVLLHVALLALLVVSFRWTKTGFFAPRSDQPIVQATAVTDAGTQKEVERLKQEQQKRDREAERKRIEEERRRKDEEVRKAEAEKMRKAEAEKKRLDEVKRLEDRRAEEKKRKEETKVAEDKQRKEETRKAEAEKKRKDQERLAKARKKEDDERRRQDSEKALQEQLVREEQERVQAQAASASSSEIARFEALIRQKVERNWTRPAQYEKGLECTIRVRTVSSGEVVSAVVVRSSGNPLFDRSAEIAVQKATPLPVPEDADLFSHFREFNFKFSPGAQS